MPIGLNCAADSFGICGWRWIRSDELPEGPPRFKLLRVATVGPTVY